MTENKSLWNWYQEGSISSSERNKILEIGYIDNSPQLYLSSWRKLYHYQLIIDRLKSKINIPGRIQTLILISTYWNPNCVIVVSGEIKYNVDVIVYEMPSRKMEEILETERIAREYYSLSSANEKAYDVERRLNGNNPITFFQLPDVYCFIVGGVGHLFSPFPLNKTVWLPFQAAKDNPDDYIKPLDIIRVSKSYYSGGVHTCVYLGNGKVVHNLPNGGVRFDSFSNFASFGGYDGTCMNGVMARYRPVVAYKRREQIIEHIGKLMGGNFNIIENNCESFANKCIYNRDVSEHVEDLSFTTKVTKKVTREAGSIVEETRIGCGTGIAKCTMDFPTSTRQFDELPRNYSAENEIKRHVESQNHYNGIVLEQRIEIAPKSEYRMS